MCAMLAVGAMEAMGAMNALAAMDVLFRCSAHPAGPVVSEIASVLACAWLC